MCCISNERNNKFIEDSEEAFVWKPEEKETIKMDH
jgi:hypothetical protein